MPESQFATLTVRRNSPRDAKCRTVIVKIDGERRAVLEFGATASLEVEPGLRQILLDNTWTTKKLELTVEPGATYEFVTGNTAGGCAMVILAFTGAAPMGLFWEEGAAKITQPDRT